MSPVTMPSDSLVRFVYTLAEEHLPPAVVSKLLADAELVCRRDNMRLGNPHVAAYALEAAARLRSGEVTQEAHKAEVGRREQLICELAATVAQWREFALLGDNSIASKALTTAADALAEVLGKYGLGGPASADPPAAPKIPPAPVPRSYG